MKPLNLASYAAIVTCLVLIFIGLFIDDLIQRRRVEIYQNQAISARVVVTNLIDILEIRDRAMNNNFQRR